MHNEILIFDKIKLPSFHIYPLNKRLRFTTKPHNLLKPAILFILRVLVSRETFVIGHLFMLRIPISGETFAYQVGTFLLYAIEKKNQHLQHQLLLQKMPSRRYFVNPVVIGVVGLHVRKAHTCKHGLLPEYKHGDTTR